jgi:hypothetical protein
LAGDERLEILLHGQLHRGDGVDRRLDLGAPVLVADGVAERLRHGLERGDGRRELVLDALVEVGVLGGDEFGQAFAGGSGGVSYTQVRVLNTGDVVFEVGQRVVAELTLDQRGVAVVERIGDLFRAFLLARSWLLTNRSAATKLCQQILT